MDKNKLPENFFERLDALMARGEAAPIEAFLTDTLAGLDEKSPAAATVLNELAAYYRGVTRYGEARECWKKAMDVLEELGWASSPQYATMMINRAGLLRLTGEYPEAVREYNAAARLLEAQGQAGSYAYVSLLNNLALTYESMGDPGEAIPLAETALKIVRMRPNSEVEVATALNNLAAMHLRSGAADKAEAMIREAIDMFNALPETNSHLFAAHATLGAVLYNTKRYAEALTEFDAALKGTETLYGKNIDYASALRSRGFTLEALGRADEAKKCLDEAADIAERLLGPDHSVARAWRREAGQ